MATFTQTDNTLFKPSPRFHHQAIPIGHQVYQYGGYSSRAESSRQVNIFNHYTEQWRSTTTTGFSPPGVVRGCSVLLHGDVFHYGGGDDHTFHGGLYRLQPADLWWKCVDSCNGDGAPMKKLSCRMVIVGDTSVGVLGGFGYPQSSLQPGSTFIKNGNFSDGSGWTNEFHVFNLTPGIWSSPTLTGDRPPPSQDFSLVNITKHKAVYFGGYLGEEKRVTNDLYIIDLETMVCAKMEPQGGEPWPVARDSHAACCLNYGDESPQLLITCGRDIGDNVLNDAWILDFSSRKWKELTLPADMQPRFAHSATAVTLGPGLVEVTMFGGCPDFSKNAKTFKDYSKIANTTIMRFEANDRQSSDGRSTREYVLEDVATNTERGTSERLTQKMLRIASKGKEIIDKLETMASSTQPDPTTVSGNSQSQAFMEVQEQKEKTQIAEKRAQMAERELQQQQTQWLVEKDELTLTEEVLGSGAWASVKVAKFRGINVAAKCFHRLIVSDYNRQLFDREMTMAARLRHPNLVQFLGAILHRDPIILMELMSTSLRAVLEHRSEYPPFGHTQIASISLDVSCALNYLHQMRPIPLIHRDISSANVLLDHVPDSYWKAKLSDYGTVNLFQNLQTQMPGNPVYAAPEASNPALHSPKMDIFSFGVLLVEMLARKFPSPEKREEYLQSIKDDCFVKLIRQCLDQKKDHRPTAIKLITELDVYLKEANKLKSQSSKTKLKTGGEIPGVEVCGETTITVTNAQQHFHWEHYGLTLDIPEGCLPSDVDQCSVNIKASLAGQYEFPESSHLVSAVYWFQCEARCKFTKPISVSIQHCAQGKNVSKLSFVRAHCTQKQLPYTFKPLEERGTFTEHSSYGLVQLESFSGVAAVQEGSEEREYCASIYYRSRDVHTQDIDFVVTWNIEAHRTVAQHHYDKKGAEEGFSSPLEFDSTEVTLDVPMDGTAVNGWKLVPLMPPVVTKKQVDGFMPGKLIPSCQLKAVVSSPESHTATQSTPLFMTVKVKGAKSPFNTFNLELHSAPGAGVFSPVRSPEKSTGPRLSGVSSEQAPETQKPKLKDLQKELQNNIADRWEDVGIQLELDEGQLATIKSDNQTSRDCVREMFKVWLKRVDPPPSWTEIAEAVHIVGYEDIAHSLRLKYCQ